MSRNKKLRTFALLLAAGMMITACAPATTAETEESTTRAVTEAPTESKTEDPDETEAPDEAETEAPDETETETETETEKETETESEEPTNNETETDEPPTGGESFNYEEFVWNNEAQIEYPIETDQKLSIWTTELYVHEEYASEADSPFHQNLQTMTGIEIEYLRPAAGADWNQALSTLYASQNLPDIIYVSGLHREAQLLINDGVTLPLNDILPEHAPDALALFEEHPTLNRSLKTDEGDYYAFPFLRGDPWLGNWLGQAVSTDVLAEFGLDVPVTIEDWDEFFYATKDSVDLPLALRSGIGLMEIFGNAFDISNKWYIDDNGEVAWGFAKPEYKDFLELMQRWYQDGIIDPDFVTMDSSALKTKVINNSIGAIHIATGTFSTFDIARQEVGGEFDFTPAPVPVSQSDGEKKYFPGESPWIGIGAFITAQSENPELAAQFLNYGYTKEGMVFWNFGIEGESFEYVDGRPQLTELVTGATEGPSSALGRYSVMTRNGFSIMMKDLNWQKNIPAGTVGDAVGNIAGNVWTDGTDGVSHRLPTISPTVEEAQEASAIENALSTYADEMYYNFILGAEPLDRFDDYMAKLEELGLARALELKQDQLDRFNAR